MSTLVRSTCRSVKRLRGELSAAALCRLGLIGCSLNSDDPSEPSPVADVTTHGIYLEPRDSENYLRLRQLRDEEAHRDFLGALAEIGICVDFVDEGRTVVLTALRGCMRYFFLVPEEASFLCVRLVLQRVKANRWEILDSTNV